MADQTQITAQVRTEFGKGAARRVRRDKMTPAVLYGHGTDPVHLTLPAHEMMRVTKKANAVVELDVEGRKQLALIKEVQRHIIKPEITHIDLVVIRKGEKVTVDVAVNIVGDAAPETLVNIENQTLQVTAEATNIPTGFEISVEGLTAGTQIHAGAVKLPSGVELVTDPDILVVNITGAISAEAREAELDEAESANAGESAGESAEDAAAEEA